MNKYATEKRLGRQPTNEDLARMHNGGLNGYKNPNTVKYWDKVQKKLGNWEYSKKEEDFEIQCYTFCVLLEFLLK